MRPTSTAPSSAPALAPPPAIRPALTPSLRLATLRSRSSTPAAELSLLDTLPERIKPALPLQRLYGVSPREVALNRNLITFPGPLHHVIRLFMQPSGVQGEDRDRRLKLRQHVDQHHIFGPKTAGERHLWSKCIDCPSKHCLRCGAKKSLIQLRDTFHRQRSTALIDTLNSRLSSHHSSLVRTHKSM